MNIVIEGMDGSGKSTLARHIHARTGMRIIESEGAPRYVGDIADRITMRAKLDRTIFVRHPVVSHPIYEAARRASGIATRELVASASEDALYASDAIFVYCHSPRGVKHRVKPHDSPEHLRMINDRQVMILHLYRQWAIEHAHVMYRFSRDDPERVVSYILAFDPVRDVREFHELHKINYDGKPRMLDFQLAQFRLKFMREELGEYEEHIDAALFELDKLTRSPSLAVADLTFSPGVFITQLAASLDALVDLTYVTLGTAHLHGYDFRRAWQRVHDANMRKVVAGEASNSDERIKLKLTKPPGWTPPVHTDLVANHAHSLEHKP